MYSLSEVFRVLTNIPKTFAHFAAPAFEQQDALFQRAFGMVSDAIAVRAFPGASVALTYRGKLVALKAFGRF
ncbi:MAG TPA: hypothetical protein VJX16_28190, partial [Terriglobales bacterium]|nr:hypothetical protein [Terriglobales bacterium]